MDYQQIKLKLSEAGRLVDQGSVREADAMIRGLIGQGLTGADLRANLTKSQIAALRKLERSR